MLGKTIRYLVLLNSIFQVQLDFLRYLGAAPDGIKQGALEKWWDEARATRNISPELTTDRLMNFIRTNELANVSPDGNWRLTEAGMELLGVAGEVFVAEKLF